MTVTDCKRLLRARSEYVLRLAAMDDVGRALSRLRDQIRSPGRRVLALRVVPL